ncbi:hypothetical protein JY651_43625 [Pyxidicoccus parkwayensis]|uniref:Lipoprotein n=1 Tax=Pyxidicoccus parkwayensis TaxID=2813578 RepID=A0ABX7NT58_9BACT|nr:hypothetical protein [Pyxidicoccus parkwaysis]QSQ21965.1 hypothetical protein JY651_43625 [Pyxidicoccus parkwaysis]
MMPLLPSLLTAAFLSQAPVEDAPTAEPSPSLEVTTTGYLDSRFTYARILSERLSPGEGQPALTNLTEGNLQLKLRFTPEAFVNTDVSLFWQRTGFIEGVEKDLPEYRPSIVVSELYGDVALTQHLSLTVGKKRVVWGPGLAQNPMDFLNPPKDPTDPAAQRAGAWLARVELPYDRFTFSVVGAAKVLRQYAGLPTALLVYPDQPTAEAQQGLVPDDRDDEAHYAVAARAYALVADTDFNLVYAFTHLYNDAFTHKHRLGLSASRVFGALEVHGEAVFQTGSTRLELEPACTGSAEALADCVARNVALASRPRLHDGKPRPQVLAGARYQFEDSAMLSAEYYFRADGLDSAGFARYVETLAAAGELARLNPALAGSVLGAMGGGTSADPGTPQRYSFDPLRRHYLFVSYSKPQIHDDFTAGASLVLSLGDFSGQLSPSLSWSARDWLTLTAAAYVPLPVLNGVEVGGRKYGELALSATDWRALMSARAFF